MNASGKDTVNLWHEVFSLSYGNTWQPIPKPLKTALGLPDNIGICGGMLQTKHAAEYTQAFCNRLNKIGEK